MASQILLNSIAMAAAYWLVALSFAVVYRVDKFFDMTPAVAYTVGAYSAFITVRRLGTPLWLAICLGVLAAAAFGVCLHFWPLGLRALRSSRPSERFIVSLGIVVVVQAGVALFVGDDTKLFNWRTTVPFRSTGLNLTEVQLATVGCAVIVGTAFQIVERFTKTGLAYRAAACDQELSKISGIPIDAVRQVAIALSAGLAGLAGILAGADVGLTPGMGFRAALMGIVAAVVGGVDRFEGLMIGAILVALVQNFAAYWLSSAWQDAIVFLILILCLIFKPSGITGNRLRRSEV